MYHQNQGCIYSGSPFEKSNTALIMLHGRGASAEDILSLSPYLNLQNTMIIAPKAPNRSWYPYSFMAPVEDNQPALDNSVSFIQTLVDDLKIHGLDEKKIVFLGFSQGACLALEYCYRNARRYGGIVAFTGGLIGKQLIKKNHKGDFAGTPILITSGDQDPHVPLERVMESISILKSLNANLDYKIFKDRMHTILKEELDLAKSKVFDVIANNRFINGQV